MMVVMMKLRTLAAVLAVVAVMFTAGITTVDAATLSISDESSWVEPIYMDQDHSDTDSHELVEADEMVEPEFKDTDADMPSNEGTLRFQEVVDGSAAAPAVVAAAHPLTMPLNIPGPYFGSYSTRMDGMGYNVPPYAFDPRKYAVLGPYRALTNRYSDGTPYPLNMEKFDSYWGGK